MNEVDPLDLDWSVTAVPSPEQWPAGLAGVVRTVLSAPSAMALAVGPDAILVYNDSYAELLGAKHPQAFGQPARIVFPENWDLPGHGGVVERVFRTGVGFHERDTVLPVQRTGDGGPVEQVHFARTYTAVRDDEGTILGVLSVVTETTHVNRAMSRVAELTERLSGAASVDSVAREALAFGVELAGADHARVVLADGPAVRMARRARIDGADDTVDRLPPVWVRTPPEARLPSTEVLTDGEPLWLHHADLPRYSDLAHEPLSPQSLRRIATVPLRAGGVRGALSFAWETPGEFSDTDRASFIAASNVIAQSLSRAKRFDEQRDLADFLQLQMLPATLPQPPGVGLAASYAPSGEGAAAGGDFYDAFEVADGRLVIVIGDVVGHGARAATIMGQVRAATRVLALRDADPGRVLDGLDEFVASLGEEVFVTMVVAVLDAGRRLSLACAGHPAPVLCSRDPDGSFQAGAVAVATGPPVGVPGTRAVLEVGLRADDVLVLYTDGLVEVPGEDPDEALVGLLAVARDVAGLTDPRRICTALLEQRRATGDDVALLVLALHERRHLVAALELPAEATSPAQARSWVRSTLAGWGATAGLVDGAVLAISELVSNALLHARSGSRVELDLDDTRLLALVTDSGGHALPLRRAVDVTSNRGRGLTVIEAICDAWGSEHTGRGTTVWFELLRDQSAGTGLA